MISIKFPGLFRKFVAEQSHPIEDHRQDTALMDEHADGHVPVFRS